MRQQAPEEYEVLVRQALHSSNVNQCHHVQSSCLPCPHLLPVPPLSSSPVFLPIEGGSLGLGEGCKEHQQLISNVKRESEGTRHT